MRNRDVGCVPMLMTTSVQAGLPLLVVAVNRLLRVLYSRACEAYPWISSMRVPGAAGTFTAL